MDDFDTFKTSREKIDPSTRKFTQAQWDNAYAAYRSSRKRVKEAGTQSDKGHAGSQRPKNGSRGYSSPSRSFSSQSPAADLRNEVRHKSAYNDLRMMIDLLAWIALGLVVLSGALKLLYYTNVPAALVAIIQAMILVVTVVALRLLAHVIIDIPDIALHSERKQDSSR